MIRRVVMLSLMILVVPGLSACGQLPVQSQPLPESSFDLEQLFLDVFSPQAGEKVLVMSDIPHAGWIDHEGWAARREMAREWRSIIKQLGDEMGFSVQPALYYSATGAHNGPLPETAMMNGRSVHFEEIMADTNIVVALTEYSATASLIAFTERFPNLRAASMPMVSKRMEQTALAADYRDVAHKCRILAEKLDRSEGATVTFSTGHEMYFDLRFRHARVDDGRLDPEKLGVHVINLPSGEAYIAPYEGEHEGIPSLTGGNLPDLIDGVLLVGKVEGNRIVEVTSESPEAERINANLAMDEALRNVAELGLGCNDRAVPTGNILEDEKVLGIHFAIGRSDHIGGTVGPDDFSDPAYVTHEDIVYPLGGEVDISSLVLQYEDGTNEEIIRDGRYIVFEAASGASWLTPTRLALLWFILIAASLSILAWDLEYGTEVARTVKLVWALVTAFIGPIGLMAYIASHRRLLRSPNPLTPLSNWRRALSATMYSMLGYSLAMLFTIAIFIYIFPDAGWASIVAVGYATPFILGLLGFRAPFVASSSGENYLSAIQRSLLAELISINFGFTGMFAMFQFVRHQWFPGSLDMANPLFGPMVSLSAIACVLTLYPLNLWMTHRGFSLWPSRISQIRERAMAIERFTTPSLSNAWMVLLLSALVTAATFILAFRYIP